MKYKRFVLSVIVFSVLFSNSFFVARVSTANAASVGQYKYEIGPTEIGYRGLHKNLRISQKGSSEIYNFHIWLSDNKNNGAITAEWSGSDGRVITLASKAEKGSLSWSDIAKKLQPYASKLSKNSWKNIGEALISSGSVAKFLVMGLAEGLIINLLAKSSCDVAAKLLPKNANPLIRSTMCNIAYGTVSM